MYERVGTLPLDRVTELAALTARFDLVPGPEGHRATPTEPTVSAFQPLLSDVFPGRWTYAILVAVAPMRFLIPHSDGPQPWTRKHVVLQTNADAWVFHGRQWQCLEAGGIYTMDPSIVHGAVNWGASPRIHLAVDHGEVNG